MDNSYRETDYEPVMRRSPRRARATDESDSAEWPRRVNVGADDEVMREEEVEQPSDLKPAPVAKSEGKVLRRAHLFGYVGLCLFTLVLFRRPSHSSESLFNFKLPVF